MPERNGKPGQWRKNKRQQKKYQKSQQGPAGAPQHSATAPGRSTDISHNATVTLKSAPFSSPSLPATRRSRYSTTIELGQEDEVVRPVRSSEQHPALTETTRSSSTKTPKY